ncbi:RNA ligase family protein [Rhodobacteraceae bacterium B1Z28]|uniref:RNA ligase family protein n=1 Tax=Ruegeria haliotis TaxID=2747601 RepID=A0ABX2PSS7_9RHOB|nr:RNA ligase family protein [Ruegeria haliotis]NVO57238.1 RNA ligase family protein [Ruegeria haliotis]
MLKKYGRTFHLPQSPGATSDDKIMSDVGALVAADEVIFTEKMDGENTTIHSDGCHPRSIDARYHSSRDWMKAFAAGISPQLAEDERIVGEYLFARHSIAYSELPTYFLGFAWIKRDVVQPWDATLSRFADLNIAPVPVLYRGLFSEDAVSDVISDLDLSSQEGFVVRVTTAFADKDMPTHLAKYVREGHVQSETHWMSAELVKNGLL